jgi:hypothetical protein
MVTDRTTEPSGHLPDEYDRQLGALHGLPDVIRSAVSTVRHVPPLGVGGTQMFAVQTYRQRERGDMIFLEISGAQGMVRVVLPPPVANVIARQRDALIKKSRSKAARAVAEDRAARGEQPAFLRGPKREAK